MGEKCYVPDCHKQDFSRAQKKDSFLHRAPLVIAAPRCFAGIFDIAIFGHKAMNFFD